MKSLIPAILGLCMTIPAQGADPLEVLLNEVRQLRLAIERSSLLGTRTQIALQRIQVQESRFNRLSQELDRARRELADLQFEMQPLAKRIKAMEEEVLHAPDISTRRSRENEVLQMKTDMERLTSLEQQRRTRETELAAQVQIEQSRLNELYDRVNDMERALDAAIRGQR